MIKTKERDRVNEIAKKLNLNKLPFKIDENNLNSLGLDIANDLTKVLNELNANTALKWCLSTIKRAKVFIIIYQVEF